MNNDYCNMAQKKTRPAVWECKIGECDRNVLPNGSDTPMRQAIREAFIKLTGIEPEYIFSGWGAELTETEQWIIDDERREKPIPPFVPKNGERVFEEGYVLRNEPCHFIDSSTYLISAYTPSGDYIGSYEDALRLVVENGIQPQKRTPTSNVCSIGYQPQEKKWYGWSHRAIHGFKVGDVVKEGDCTADGLPVGFTAKNLADAKKMAEAFAESVS
jgi:hypothetical protein